MSIRFSLPSAKNPIERPSGDQKGNPPFSVPGSAFPSPVSLMARSQRRTPLPSWTGNTMWVPSGEMAGSQVPSKGLNCISAGGGILERTTIDEGDAPLDLK